MLRNRQNHEAKWTQIQWRGERSLAKSEGQCRTLGYLLYLASGLATKEMFWASGLVIGLEKAYIRPLQKQC